MDGGVVDCVVGLSVVVVVVLNPAVGDGDSSLVVSVVAKVSVERLLVMKTNNKFRYNMLFPRIKTSFFILNLFE